MREGNKKRKYNTNSKNIQKEAEENRTSISQAMKAEEDNKHHEDKSKYNMILERATNPHYINEKVPITTNITQICKIQSFQREINEKKSRDNKAEERSQSDEG